MHHDYGPMILTSGVVLVALSGVGGVARSTRNKLVAREYTADSQAAYTRAMTPERIERQLENREVRQQQALTAHRMYTWCLILLALIAAVTVFALLSAHMGGVLWYVAGIALLLPAALVWRTSGRRAPRFPDLPERAPLTPGAPASDTDPDDVPQRPERPGTRRAPQDKRARRRHTSASRRANRRR